MPQPTISDVHIDRPLSIMSVGFQQEAKDFVSMEAFPSIPVQNRTDMYWVYNRGDFFRDNMQMRADGTPAAGGGYKLATQTYLCNVWAVKKIIGDQTRANSDAPLNPDRDATEWLTNQALRNREIQWTGTYFKTGVWGTELAGAGSADPTHVKYWNASGSDPVKDVLAMRLAIKKSTGLWPNKLILGANVYNPLLTNAAIIDRLKYGQTAPGPVNVTDNDLATLFRVEKVLVTSAIKTTSPEDLVPNSDTTPDTFDFIGGNHALLVYAAPSPGLMTASAGYTFNWVGYSGNVGGAGFKIKKYRWEIDAADHIEIEQNYGFGLVSKYLGGFFKDVVQ